MLLGVGRARGERPSWLMNAGDFGDFNDIREAHLPRQYLAAVYFVMTTISTTGYGDIGPKSGVEQGLCIVMQVRRSRCLAWGCVTELQLCYTRAQQSTFGPTNTANVTRRFVECSSSRSSHPTLHKPSVLPPPPSGRVRSIGSVWRPSTSGLGSRGSRVSWRTAFAPSMTDSGRKRSARIRLVTRKWNNISTLLFFV